MCIRFRQQLASKAPTNSELFFYHLFLHFIFYLIIQSRQLFELSQKDNII